MTLTPSGVACRLGLGELVTLAVSYSLMPPSARPERLTRAQLSFTKAIVGNTGREVPPVARRPVVAVYHAWVHNSAAKRIRPIAGTNQIRAPTGARSSARWSETPATAFFCEVPVANCPPRKNVGSQTGRNAGVSSSGAAQESNLPSLGLPDLTGFEASACWSSRPAG